MSACPRWSPWGRGAIRVASLALLLSLVAAHDKRSDMPQVPFTLGSRYGRSPERLMTPRNDRFFMGSRYGKRSMDGPGGPGGPGGPLLCEYTGVMSLYDCSSLRTHPRLLMHKREESAGPSDEE